MGAAGYSPEPDGHRHTTAFRLRFTFEKLDGGPPQSRQRGGVRVRRPTTGELDGNQCVRNAARSSSG